MVMPILLALLYAIVPASASGQQPGYTPCTDSIADKPIIGRWLHDSVQTHGAFAGVRVWARLEIRADGEIVEDYFTEDPTAGRPIAFSRLFSTWTSGEFADPDPAKGAFPVMRLEPYLSQVYSPGSESYSSLRGGLLPVFRRFAVSDSKDELTLWGSAVLQLPGSASAMSYPSGLEIRHFRSERFGATSVEKATWGQVRSQIR